MAGVWVNPAGVDSVPPCWGAGDGVRGCLSGADMACEGVCDGQKDGRGSDGLMAERKARSFQPGASPRPPFRSIKAFASEGMSPRTAGFWPPKRCLALSAGEWVDHGVRRIYMDQAQCQH